VDLHTAYLEANQRIRRQINQAIFERFLISDDGGITGRLRAPFDLLLQASGTADQDGLVRLEGEAKEKPRGPLRPRGLSYEQMVGRTGYCANRFEHGVVAPPLALEPRPT
jgi:hypothetical protein